MRRFHWRGAVALNPPTGCHGRMVAVGEGAPYFVRCSELTGAPHSHACAGELSIVTVEPSRPSRPTCTSTSPHLHEHLGR